MYNIYLKNIKDLIEKRKETGPVEESNYLSSVIKNRRIELKLTLSDTTQDICSEAFLSKVERNLMNPINERVEMLCERLDLDYQTLINLESNIVEEGGISSVYTASISGEKFTKNLVINNVNHAPHTESYMTNFGIGYDQGKLVVDGIGDIRNGAHGSVNKQHSTMVVFDDKAKATNRPLLLIEEDDVVANHASAVGKIDEQTIFYLCSRGLTLKQAKKYISLGYFKPVLAFLSDLELKEKVLDYLEEVIKDD